LEKVCIDTDVLIELSRRNLLKHIKPHMNLYLSIISAYEYLRGLAVLGRDIVYAERILKTLFTIIPLTEKTIIEAAEIYASLHRKGVLIPDPDILIAASCIVEEISLSTFNIKHFKRLKEYGLEIVDPNEIIDMVTKSR